MLVGHSRSQNIRTGDSDEDICLYEEVSRSTMSRKDHGPSFNVYMGR